MWGTRPWCYDNAEVGPELERFRAKDFSSIDAALKKHFPNSAQRIRSHSLALPSKVAEDGAGQYVGACLRIVTGVSETQRQALDEHFRSLRLDTAFLLAEQKAVLQQAHLSGLWPDSTGQLRSVRFSPYHVAEIDWDDPWAEGDFDLRGARRVVLYQQINPRLPVSPRTCKRIVLERDRAYYEMPGDKAGGRGLLTPSGHNPIGRVPLVASRREVPESGGLPRPALDIYECAVGLILIISDALAMSAHGSIKPVVATGEDVGSALPASLPLRAGELYPLPGDVKLYPIDMTPNIEGYLKGAAMVVKLLTQFRNLRPQGYDASIITGPAANLDREGFLEERRRQEVRCAQHEQDHLDLLVDIHNLVLGRALRIGRAKVEAHYRYVRTRENVLQEAQARAILIEQGLWSVVEEVAEIEGCSFDEAIDRIEQRNEWRQKMPSSASSATPGLDKTAPNPPGRPPASDPEPALVS